MQYWVTLDTHELNIYLHKCTHIVSYLIASYQKTFKYYIIRTHPISSNVFPSAHTAGLFNWSNTKKRTLWIHCLAAGLQRQTSFEQYTCIHTYIHVPPSNPHSDLANKISNSTTFSYIHTYRVKEINTADVQLTLCDVKLLIKTTITPHHSQ